VFGSQISEDDENPVTGGVEEENVNWEDAVARSPATLRGEPVGRRAERSRWRTLRDFVDERGIEEVIERMDDDRAALEVCTHTSVLLSRHVFMFLSPRISLEALRVITTQS
jgi:autophagy-related protein 17